jgi:phage protein D
VAQTDEQVFVKVDGRQLDLAAAQLLRVGLEQALLLPDTFDIVLAGGLDWLKEGSFDIGKEVQLELVNGSGTRKTLITGEVTGLMPSMTQDNDVHLQVRGYDKSHRLLRGRQTRLFNQTKDSDIAQRIAQEVGLGCNYEATQEVHQQVLQHNQTNLEFLQERAAAIGYQVGVQAQELYFLPLGESPSGAALEAIDLTWGDSLEEFEVSRTTPAQATKVLVRGWDPVNKVAVVGESRPSTAGPELSNPDTGSDVIGKAFGMSAPMTVIREDVFTQAEADRLAQAICDELQGCFTTAVGTASGNPALHPGAEVRINGVGIFDGKYRISSTRHIFDQLGYRTTFNVEGSRKPHATAIHASPGVSAKSGQDFHLTPGIVTNNADPLNQGRVKVKLPALADELELGWCRLLSPFAGGNHGFYFVPEIDDEVLVAFIGDQPIVIGALWNGKDTPPFTDVASDRGVRRRGIRSDSGHLLYFDDTARQETVVIEDKNHNQIKIESQNNRLHITVKGEIVIETEGNLNLKSSGNMNIEAGGRLNIKGATVNIN